jgi:FkbM family methyltransferase
MADAQVTQVFSYQSDTTCPEYSIIVPIYNQDAVIVDHLQSIVMNTVGSYEFIVIFDACEDTSESVSLKFFQSLSALRHPMLKRILAFKTDKSIFETSCDNIGFRSARGKYWIEIQADMKMRTWGYNVLLSNPCRIWSDVFAVSGRCCHQWDNFSVGAGKLGTSVEQPLKLSFGERNNFYIAETCNRGPLLFVGERLKSLNYLDEDNFVLGDDDHDVMARAYDKQKWINGYFPIEFESPLHLGSTRKPRNKINEERLVERLRKSTGGYLKSRTKGKPRGLEIRKLPNFHESLMPLFEPKAEKLFKTIVTAASSNHANTLIQLLTHLANHRTGTRVIVYDLGLQTDQREKIQNLCRKHSYILETFDYNNYPPHLNINVFRGAYAWKPNIIREVGDKYKGLVLWMDSGNLIKQDIDTFWSTIEKEGFYAGLSEACLPDFTHSTTLARLKCTSLEIRHRMRNAACIGINFDFAWVCSLIHEWSEYANRKDCIAPLGACWLNHRYDQSLLSILYYRYQETHKFRDLDVCGTVYITHRDAPEDKVDQKKRLFLDAKHFLSSYGSDVHSQNGEDGIIEHIFEQIGCTQKNGWVCEFGAADGKWNSNTFRLVEHGWKAVYIEADERKAEELQKVAQLYTNIIPMHKCISPDSSSPDALDTLLSTTPCPIDFDLLSIDIDSFDYQVWKSVVKYKPKVVIIEINSSISPLREGYIHESIMHNGQMMDGTSYMAMVRLGLEKGYTLVCHTGNLIWIRNDLSAQIYGLCSEDPTLRPDLYFCESWMSVNKTEYDHYEQWKRDGTERKEKRTDRKEDVKQAMDAKVLQAEIHVTKSPPKPENFIRNRSEPNHVNFNFLDVCKEFHIQPKGIIHVGAHLAEELPWYRELKVPRVAWIEGNETLIPSLQKIVANEPGHSVHHGLISDKREQRKFNITNNGQSSSYLEFGTHATLHPNITVERSELVMTITLPEIIKDFRPFDTLNLDIQGAELDALKGIGNNLVHIKYIYMEINTADTYKGCAKLHDVDAFMSEKGFRRAKAFTWGEHDYGEALYIRKDECTML